MGLPLIWWSVYDVVVSSSGSSAQTRGIKIYNSPTWFTLQTTPQATRDRTDPSVCLSTHEVAVYLTTAGCQAPLFCVCPQRINLRNHFSLFLLNCPMTRWIKCNQRNAELLTGEFRPLITSKEEEGCFDQHLILNEDLSTNCGLNDIRINFEFNQTTFLINCTTAGAAFCPPCTVVEM